MPKRITDRRAIAFLFWLCWIVYFAAYVGRVNYAAVMVAAMEDGFLSKSMAGLTSTAAFAAYGVGQLVNGYLVDRLDTRRMMALGLLGTLLSNVLMAMVRQPAWMPLIWGFNGYMQSMTWGPVMKLFSGWLSAADCRRSMVHFSTCSIMATLAAYGLSSALLALFSWRTVFVAAAVLLAAALPFWWLGYAAAERRASDIDPGSPPSDKPASPAREPEARARPGTWVAGSGLLFFAFGAVMQGVLKDGLFAWAPTYIFETFRMSTARSVMLSTLLPVVSLSGVYAASFSNRRLFRNEAVTCAVFFLIGGGALAALPKLGGSAAAAVALLAAAMSAVAGVNTLIVGLVPIRFGKIGRAATVTGALNASVYAGSALSAYGTGLLSGRLGWAAVYVAAACAAAAGTAVCLAGVRRWSRYKP